MPPVVETDAGERRLHGGGALGERGGELLEYGRSHGAKLRAGNGTAYRPESRGASLTWGRAARPASGYPAWSGWSISAGEPSAARRPPRLARRRSLPERRSAIMQMPATIATKSRTSKTIMSCCMRPPVVALLPPRCDTYSTTRTSAFRWVNSRSSAFSRTRAVRRRVLVHRLGAMLALRHV